MNAIRFLPTSVHGVLDYLVGIALIAAPYLFGFASVGGIAVYLPIILGIGLILYVVPKFDQELSATKHRDSRLLLGMNKVWCQTFSQHQSSAQQAGFQRRNAES